MKRAIPSNRFKHDLKLVLKRGWNEQRLNDMIALLEAGLPLPMSAYPHKLSGEYEGLWECHVAHDWLLVYAVTDEEVLLARTGTHEDLFT
jgi:mRNA interferase YafQ